MGNEAKSLVTGLLADSVSQTPAVPYKDNEFFSSQSFRDIIIRGVKNVAPLPDEGGSLLDPRLLAATQEYRINLVEVVLPDSDFNEFQATADACATRVDIEKNIEELTTRKGYKIERGAIFSRFEDSLQGLPGGSRPYEEAGAIVLWQNPDILNKRTGTQVLNSVFGIDSLNIPTETEGKPEAADVTVYGEDGSKGTINMLIVKRQGNLTAGESQQVEETQNQNSNISQPQPSVGGESKEDNVSATIDYGWASKGKFDLSNN